MYKKRGLFFNQFADKTIRSIGYVAILLSLLLSGCSSSLQKVNQVTYDFIDAFPFSNSIPGWTISQKVEIYNHENLFTLVDGQADSFFAYGFEKVAVQRYQNTSGILLNIEIWQLAAPGDAYGLFSAGQRGSPIAVGNDGDLDLGRRLAFWQNRYFINLDATQSVPDETLKAFASAIVGSLPIGGEPPLIISRLPKSGLIERSSIFFHEEISIQTQVWLGGENILDLNQNTNGVIAKYEIGTDTAQLMLIEYPNTEKAQQGLKALASSNITDLVVSDVQGNTLGTIFGKVDSTKARLLLQEALN
jgi:hypothetical protein